MLFTQFLLKKKKQAFYFVFLSRNLGTTVACWSILSMIVAILRFLFTLHYYKPKFFDQDIEMVNRLKNSFLRHWTNYCLNFPILPMWLQHLGGIFHKSPWPSGHGIKLGIWGSGVWTPAPPWNLWPRVAKKITSDYHLKTLCL